MKLSMYDWSLCETRSVARPRKINKARWRLRVGEKIKGIFLSKV